MLCVAVKLKRLRAHQKMTTHARGNLMQSDPRLALIGDSFHRLTGRQLVNRPEGVSWAEALWAAPCVVVAHGTEADPVFFYGNQRALKLFDMPFDAFTRLPSRLSAEPVAQAERAALLARVTRDGFIADYAGVRIAASGARFRIEQAVVWNLIDSQGVLHGQAATFSRWRCLPDELVPIC